MSTGTQILFGAAIAIVLFAGVSLTRRRRRPAERRPVTPDLETRLRDLVADGKAIMAIKELRQATGMGLREAKDYVDALEATGEPPAPRTGEVSEATVALARELVAGGKKIQAVKVVREDTGWGLKQSKDFVDRL